jgi:hypothetical protein
MRTTVNIPDEAFALLSKKAKEKGVSIGEVVGEATFIAYRDRPGRKDRPSIELPVAGRGGLQPGVDLDSNASLLDAMDEVS